MNKVILWSTHCPRCKVLEFKLKQKDIDYEINTDVETMLSKGFQEAPKLEVNGTIYDFKNAVEWLKGQ